MQKLEVVGRLGVTRRTYRVRLIDVISFVIVILHNFGSIKKESSNR